MDIDPNLQALVFELGAHIGLDGLELDQEGFAALRFDEHLIVNLQALPDEDALMLYVDLGPPASGEELYESLLKANLFWRSTLGATLSLSSDSPPHAVLAKEFQWRVFEFGEFISLLERFVATSEDWSELVKGSPEDQKELKGSSGNSMGNEGMIRV